MPAEDRSVQFHAASQLTPSHWFELQHVIQHRVLRYFRTQDLLDEADANGMLSWQGTGGFSIDASVRIEGDDRAGLGIGFLCDSTSFFHGHIRLGDRRREQECAEKSCYGGCKNIQPHVTWLHGRVFELRLARGFFLDDDRTV